MELCHLRYTRRGVLQTFTCLAIILFLLRYIGFLDFSARRYNTWTWTPCPGSSAFEQTCKTSRASIAQELLVVVKTGASEPQARLRLQLATMLSDIPPRNIIILSDMAEQVGTHHVHDVYADVSERERAGYPEFALYDAQQEYQRMGKDTRELPGGWEMSKYMDLAMQRKIWTMLQGTGDGHATSWKWFIIIDTDTFIEWDNLLGLLEHLDASKQLYLGSPVWLPNLQFAHGGSAYVLSYGALKVLNGETADENSRGSLHSQFGLNTTALCCGDEALARVLKTKGINLKGYWPMFNGEVPATLAFGRDLWCEPVISLHHLGGDDMQSLWQWTADWRVETRDMHPLLFKDVFSFVAPQIVNVLEDWDNIDESMKVRPSNRASHTSFDNCKAACEEDKLCFQYLYHGTTCALSYHIRLGRQRLPEQDGTRKYRSGWCVERIRDWTMKTECTSAHWVASNP